MFIYMQESGATEGKVGFCYFLDTLVSSFIRSKRSLITYIPPYLAVMMDDFKAWPYITAAADMWRKSHENIISFIAVTIH